MSLCPTRKRKEVPRGNLRREKTKKGGSEGRGSEKWGTEWGTEWGTMGYTLVGGGRK
jgi:hypothetical protein